MRVPIVTLAAAALLAGTPAAFAQSNSGGTIAQGDATLTISDSPANPAADPNTSGNAFRSNSSIDDHLFYNWWWYRVNGVNTREVALNSAATWNWGGDTGTLNYTFSSFSAVLTWKIIDTGQDTAQVNSTVRVTNTSAAPLSLSMFHAIDFDYAGTIGNDSALLASPGLITITDTQAAAPWNGLSAFYAAVNPTTYNVAPFGEDDAPLTLLTNTAVSNFAGTGLPFASNDFTGGWQFNRTIASGASETFIASFGVGAYVPPGTVLCPADLDNDGSFTNGGTPDGGVDINDLLYFLIGFEAGAEAVDLDNDGDPAQGTPDGGVDVNDLLFFLARFETGC